MAAVFRPQNMGFLRGPRYSFEPLRIKLNSEFGNARIKTLNRKLILVSATLDRFQIKLITNMDEVVGAETDISLVDAALATAAAPTYFSAVKPEGKEQSYVDGGVWANSPSLIGYFTAVRKLKIPEQRIKILHLGTGTTPTGIPRPAYDRLRPLGMSTIRTILELVFACQVDGIEYQLMSAMERGQYFSINPQLQQSIALDDASTALRDLPALAETTFQQHSHALKDFLPKRAADYKFTEAKLANYEMLAATGLRAFIPHRRYYAQFRDGAQSISSYVQRAQHNLTFVSINLMTGTQWENLKRIIEEKLRANSKFSATISLLSPKNSALMDSVAPILNMTGHQLALGISDTLGVLKLWKSELGPREKNRLTIQTHNVLPFGSAIIIDEGHPQSTIQIETKGYKVALEESFAFEIADGHESGLYSSLLEGFRTLLGEGTKES